MPKMYVTKRPNGMYLMTALRPVVKKIAGTQTMDAWPTPGDPVSLTHCCPAGVAMIFGRKLVTDAVELEPVRVQVAGSIMTAVF